MLMLVIVAGVKASSSRLIPLAMAFIATASFTRPAPMPWAKKTLSARVRLAKVVSKCRVLGGKSVGATA